jgi:malonyl-CoA O-methyltransferase
MTPMLSPREAYALWAASYPAHAHNPLMLAEEQAMLALLPPDLNGMHILDAGCGSGRYLIHAASRGASHLVGVDLSQEMLLKAKQATEVRRQGTGGRGQEAGGRRQFLPGTAVDTRSCLLQASAASVLPPASKRPALIQASLDALPITTAWADLTICGLTIGHLEQLEPALAELKRATRPGGTILISDFHPIGEELGWRREFLAGGQRYAVRHTARSISQWQASCRSLNLRINTIQEPYLDPAHIPPGAQFDERALTIPVALVLSITTP